MLAASSPAAQKLVDNINSAIVNPLVVIMFTVALIAFLWGVREYIAGADNPEVRTKGAQHILWGIVGMALMLMTFTIIKIVLNTFGIDHSDEVDRVLGK